MKRPLSAITVILLLAPAVIWCTTTEGKVSKTTKTMEREIQKDKDTLISDDQQQNKDKAMEWFSKGYKASMANNYDEAIRCFKKAIAIIPNFSSAYQNLGSIYIKREKFDEAMVMLKKAIEIDPQNAGAHYNLGIAYDVQKRTDEAIAEYEKAIMINPDLAGAYLNLGVAYTDKGFDAMASDSFYHAGCIYLKEGNKDGALRALEGLKGTESRELEQSLFDKLYPGINQKKDKNELTK